MTYRMVLRRFRRAPLFRFVLPVLALVVSWVAPNAAVAQNLPFGPVGPYQQTCETPFMGANGTLAAQCQNFFGVTDITSLENASHCADTSYPGLPKGAIWNVDGVLRCVYSSHPSQNNRDLFDIISVPVDEKTANTEVKVWRIDHPDVITGNPKPYDVIRVKPGDLVSIQAGGCAQTGGSGDTWKSYTNPSGDDADHLYSGTIWIPGVLGDASAGGERIAGVIGPVWAVPRDLPPTVTSRLALNIGYQDDGLSDNGYYSHDNGNNNQCGNVGPAWITVRVTTDLTPQHEAQSSPGSKPFDLVWDMRRGIDANGLPLNPTWHDSGAAGNKDQAPNFEKLCGNAFSQSGAFGDDTNVDEGQLANCTSQSPTTDLSTNGFDMAFSICNNGEASNIGTFFAGNDGTFVMPGHLNWALATFVGPLEWEAYSGDWPQDHDYNFRLNTTNAITYLESELGLEFNGEETIDNLGNPWWKQVIGSRDDKTINDAISGDVAVVTGLVGIDGVHSDGQAEVHPVLSMAIRIAQHESGGVVDETWVYFLRKTGNEGECSHMNHTWDGFNGDYYVAFPWPSHVNHVQVLGSTLWKDQSANVKTSHGIYDGWTYVKLQLPDDGAIVDGQVQLRYTKTPGAPPEPKKAGVGAKKHDAEFDRDRLEAAMKLPAAALRTRFQHDVLAAEPPHPQPRPRPVMISLDTAIIAGVNPALRDGRVDKLTRVREAANPRALAAAATMKPMVETYRTKVAPAPH